MTDHSAPGVYTQPDGDADDVLGHRIAGGRVIFEQEGDDVEGHRAADRIAGAQPDFRAADRIAATDGDEDDVEGHRAADRVV